MASNPVRRDLKVLHLVFFLSGITGLLFGMVWIRLFSSIFGSTTSATGVVFSAFLIGLALGSYLFGHLIDRLRWIVLIFAILEMAIGFIAAALPFILDIVEVRYRPLFLQHLESHLTILGIQFIISFIVLFLPAILMGGMLPVLGRYLVKQGQSATRDIGRIFALQTLGASIGCILTGFVLFIQLGVRLTLFSAAGLNIVAAILVILILRQRLIISKQEYKQDQQRWVKVIPVPQHIISYVLLLFFCSGFTALAYEVILKRMLSLLMGSSLYSFSLMMTIFLLGLACGSALIARTSSRSLRAIFWFGIIEIIIGSLSIIGFFLCPQLPGVFLKLFVSMGSGYDWISILYVQIIFTFFVIFPITLLFGMTFPLVIGYMSTQYENIGRIIGKSYSIMVFGAISGTLITGYVLLPYFGTMRSLICIAVLNVGLGILAIVHKSSTPLKTLTLVVFLSLSLGSAYLLTPSTELLAIGVFDVSQFASSSGEIKTESILEKQKQLFFLEGPTASVAVFQDDDDDAGLSLKVNGRSINGGGLQVSKNLKLLGHLPMMFHANPQHVLVVGLGMGVTAGITSFYSPEQILIVEPIPEIVQCAQYFTDHNNNVLNKPFVKVLNNDGDNYVALTDQIYDVITSDPMHPLVTGSGKLYSVEYYHHCLTKLSDNGIFCQWLPLHRLSQRDIQILLASFIDVFPDGNLWLSGFDAFLIGSNKPLNVPMARIRKYFNDPRIHNDLEDIFRGNPLNVISCGLLDSSDIKKLIQNAPLNTEDFPIIEYTIPKSMYSVNYIENVRLLLKQRQSPKKRYVHHIFESDELNYLDQIDAFIIASDSVVEGRLYLAEGDYASAIDRFDDALNHYPEHTIARYELAQIYYHYGMQAAKQIDNKTAVDNYNKALQIYPEERRIDIYSFLSQANLKIGDKEAAILALQRAIQIAPDDFSMHEKLVNLLSDEGQLENARMVIDSFLIKHPNHQPAQQLFKKLEKKLLDDMPEK